MKHNRDSMMMSDAWFLAERVHRGQTDARGRPYLFHVLEVAADVTNAGAEAVCVALLHDFYEDGGMGDLEDFSLEIRDAVDAITRLEGEVYADYIVRLKQNSLARVVKLADLRRNLGDCPRASLFARYYNAISVLEAEEN